MRSFSMYHPAAVLIYFVCVLVITMFINIPLILILSLSGAWVYHLLQDKGNFIRSIRFDIIIFLVIAVANPIFTHRGKTILLFMNGKPITLEALFYGVCMAVMMIGVIHWCRILTEIMTSDKLLYLCGKLAPNLSVVLSMSLRYIPLFRIQSAKVNYSQTAMGLYSEDSYMNKAKGSMRVFSIVLTWSLENAIDTANSMRARGYGLGKRSQFSNYRITMSDILLIVGSVLLTSITLYGCTVGFVDFEFYPKLSKFSASVYAILIYLSCGLLVFLPVLIELKEKLKWKFYRSRI